MMVLISISWIANGIEHLFMFFEPMCAISYEIVVLLLVVILVVVKLTTIKKMNIFITQKFSPDPS